MKFIDVVDKCYQPALREPLLDKHLIIRTEVVFQAAGYVVLTKDDPNQIFISTSETDAPVAYDSKTFTHSQVRISVNAMKVLAFYLPFKEFGQTFWGRPKPVTIMTDNVSVTRFLQNKNIPPPILNAGEFVLQINFYYSTRFWQIENGCRFLIRVGDRFKLESHH